MASSTVENYIKHIFVLQQDNEQYVSMGAISEKLSVVPGTATTMIKALAEANLLSYEPRVGARLTPAGERLALNILRRHRLIELFLHEVLEMDWSEVHEEAEELEHSISERVLERIDKMLGHPEFDPHGDPIPTACGQYDQTDLESLAHCTPGVTYSIARLTNQEPDFLQFAESQGLLPGVKVVVKEHNRPAESLTLCVGGEHSLVLGLGAARTILIR